MAGPEPWRSCSSSDSVWFLRSCRPSGKGSWHRGQRAAPPEPPVPPALRCGQRAPRQARQKLWPQGSVTGSRSGSRQMGQLKGPLPSMAPRPPGAACSAPAWEGLGPFAPWRRPLGQRPRVPPPTSLPRLGPPQRSPLVGPLTSGPPDLKRLLRACPAWVLHPARFEGSAAERVSKKRGQGIEGGHRKESGKEFPPTLAQPGTHGEWAGPDLAHPHLYSQLQTSLAPLAKVVSC